MLNKKALAASLSAPPALYVEDVFSTYIYTGNGATQTISNGIDLSGEGGAVWFKSRSDIRDNNIVDSANGTSTFLVTNKTEASNTPSGVTSFNNSGFTLNGDTANNNQSTWTYASWTFRKAEKFFDVVTYTGNGTSQTINHNLGSVPGCIIVKSTSAANDWRVYHRSLATVDSALRLNSTAAAGSSSTFWNSTAPTSTQFTVGSDGSVNANGGTYVAYLFAHDAGGFGDSGSESVIKCGSYSGNGSNTGPVIDLGWEPQWVLIKRANVTGSWFIFDNMRGFSSTSQVNVTLSPNLTNAEPTPSTGYDVYPTSTGFQPNTTSTSFNASGSTYIYIAIRRGPMKTPEAGTEVFEPFVDRTSIANKTNGTMGPVDLTMQTQVSDPLAGYHFSTFDRLRGSTFLQTSATAAESSGSVFFDTNTGIRNGTWFSAGGVGYNFKRAPGFFDVVCYTGTGSARTVTHNLGVAPELMIVKRRDSAENWAVYASGLTDPASWRWLKLNLTDAQSASSAPWDDTAPTSTVFSLSGVQTTVNASGGTYVAYLFATLAGVSKVGSYTGTGNLLQVNCGFTSSARLVLIKRTDTTGDWYVWDSARGIVSGNDPYLLMNSTASEVTNTDYIDTYSSGFEVTAAASTTVNVTGGTYIFLAIA